MLFILISFLYDFKVIVVFQYYLLQEIASFHFILSLIFIFQFYVLLFKGGYSPFYFWIIKIVKSFSGLVLVWLLILQKPFSLIPLFNILENSQIYLFLVFCLLLIYFNYLFVRNWKLLMVLSRCESLGWFIFVLRFNSIINLIFFLLYLIRVYLIITSLNSLDLLIIIISFPLFFPFILKFVTIFYLIEMFRQFLVVIFFITFISVLIFIFFLFILVLTPQIKKLDHYRFLVLMFSLTFLFFGYCKINIFHWYWKDLAKFTL